MRRVILTKLIIVKVMDQKRMCSYIPKLNNTLYTKELMSSEIFVSDISVEENFCLSETKPNDIHLLLAGDTAG